GNAVDGDRAGLLTQRDGGVHPDAALGLVGLARVFTAADSPPEVHQWMTSALSGWGGWGDWAVAGRAAASAAAARRRQLNFILSPDLWVQRAEVSPLSPQRA
ncbi:hypothetical protein, partial [Escherichia coli]|uniref:hypothetical protein n=1 Tax=Escherichia coli TaxID=562 RepID=UPI001BC8C027